MNHRLLPLALLLGSASCAAAAEDAADRRFRDRETNEPAETCDPSGSESATPCGPEEMVSEGLAVGDAGTEGSIEQIVYFDYPADPE